MTQTAVELWQELACPRDHSRLEPRGETLVCEHGHEYPFVDGIPVMVVDDEIAPTQPGYWSNPEQIAARPRRRSRRRSRARRSTRTSPS